MAELIGEDILRRRKGVSAQLSSDKFFIHIDRSKHTFLTDKDEKCYMYLSFMVSHLMVD